MKNNAIVPGNIFPTNNCGNILVLDNRGGSRRANIRFIDSGYERVASYWGIRDGSMDDPLCHRQCRIGIGRDENPTDKFQQRIYHSWEKLLSISTHLRGDKAMSLRRGAVCREWLVFDTFKEWYLNTCSGSTVFRDAGSDKTTRPILTRSLYSLMNIYYSPTTTDIVPAWVFWLVRDLRHARGWTYVEKTNNYRVTIHYRGEATYLGSYPTILEAHNVFVNAKVELLQKAAQSPVLTGRIKYRLRRLAREYEKRMTVPTGPV